MSYLERNAKLPLFVEEEDLVMYRENPDKSISKVLELIREFSEVAGHKINIQKSMVFVYTLNKKLGIE